MVNFRKQRTSSSRISIFTCTQQFLTRNCVIAIKYFLFICCCVVLCSLVSFTILFFEKIKFESMRKMSIEIVYLLENSHRILTDVTFRFSNHRHVFLTLTSSFSLDSLSLALDAAIKKQHTSTTLFKDVYVNVTFLAHSCSCSCSRSLLKFSPTVTRIEVMICFMHSTAIHTAIVPCWMCLYVAQYSIDKCLSVSCTQTQTTSSIVFCCQVDGE